MRLRRLLLPLLSCLSLAAAAQGGAPAAEAAGTVALVDGEVRVYDAALKGRSVRLGDGVGEGESIVTGADGELHLKMADGGYIAVRPNTKMRIAGFRAQGDADDKGVFGLLAGSFRSITGWIGRYNPRNYRIDTPTATIGVRGTDHEPLVIPEGSAAGEAGTYDKVNAGASFIETPHGRVEVAERRAAFAPLAGKAAPRLLDAIPRFFKPTRHEHLLEHRHEAIQRSLEKKRDERRKLIEQRQAHPAKAAEKRAQAREGRAVAERGKRQELRHEQRPRLQAERGERRREPPAERSGGHRRR